MSYEPRGEQIERLLSVQKAARAVADSAADWWRAFTEAANSTVTEETLSVLCRQSLSEMQTVLGADEVSILLADAAGDALVSRSSIGLGEQESTGLHIPAGKGMAGQVLASRQPLVVRDLSSVPLVSPVLRERGLRSVVAVPILSDRRVLGVLHAGSRHLGHFTTSDAELLGLLAERLAVVLERVQLFEEQRRIAQVMSFLAETAKIMADASDLTATLDELARAALPVLGDICLIDVMEDGILKRIVARHADPARQHLADRLRTEFPPDTNGSHPAAEVLRMGGSRWSTTMSDEFLHATTHDHRHFALTKELGFRSYLVVPISVEPIVGTLTMVSCSRPLSRSDVDLAESLARHVGSVVAKARQLDSTAQTSHVLQAALLPAELPAIAGLLIHTSYIAASSSLEVGGDFYDAMELPDGRAWVAIGDVEGHDRRAAAVMGQLRSAVRTLACQGNEPGAVIHALRSSWKRLGFDRLATILVGEIDPVTGRMALASAGHLPPLLVREAGAEFLSPPPSPLLGVDARMGEPLTTTLCPGDVLLLFTDGVLSERARPLDEAMRHLRSVALRARRTPEAICSCVIDDKADGDDDAALLALSLDPVPGAPPRPDA